VGRSFALKRTEQPKEQMKRLQGLYLGMLGGWFSFEGYFVNSRKDNVF